MKCPHCDHDHPAEAAFCPLTGAEIEHTAKGPLNRNVLIPAILISLFFLAGGVYFMCGQQGALFIERWQLVGVEPQSRKDIGFGEPLSPEDIDAEGPAAYYLSNSDVYKQIDVGTSSNVLTAAQMRSSADERGFGECTITTCYDMSGTYFPDEEITADSDSSYPAYEFYYVTPSGEVWIVENNNGDYVASPLSYNSESGRTELVYAEHSFITSYDSGTNSYYELAPSNSLMEIKTLERIDAKTLDSLTSDKIAEQ